MPQIYRVFVEKKDGFDVEARRLREDLGAFLGGRHPDLAGLRGLRILNRYDLGRLGGEQFRRAAALVLSEPPCDRVFFGEGFPAGDGDVSFAVEYLPGQYDQRADSAEQCAELVCGVRPQVRCARVYVLEPGEGGLAPASLDAVKQYLINPVDSREADPALPPSLAEETAEAEDIPVLSGFRGLGREGLAALARDYGLAMSLPDLVFCRDYFSGEGRDPVLTELRILDTYWSDHCRHTTFTTALEEISIDSDSGGPGLGDSDSGDSDSAGESASLVHALGRYEAARREVYGPAAEERPRTLMDMAVIGTKVLKKRGLAGDVDESKEINACTIRINAEFEDGSREPWLLLFKNETHNHPTEIEPFGGAATCLGGAIRDPLSGRAYVYQAMRLSGGGDPRTPLSGVLPGKLPQIKIAREAASGYSSYGNQIGLATGQVSEFYHPGFTAKRMELGAVIGAVPAAWVRREEPEPGDLIILAGGATGRDGIGGATGSSKVHTGESVEKSGAEVQKGNAVEERKLQRLFRKREVSGLIKRCNDFGAGGVSVAVGELAAGIDIDLDAAPKKYAGLDGTELAISESQERMAVVVSPDDGESFIRAAAAENLGAVIIARVVSSEDDGARLRMFWRGKAVADLSRKFLNSAGAGRSAKVRVSFPDPPEKPAPGAPEKISPAALVAELETELSSLRSGSRRGLQERFDGSIGAGSVLFPWGGETQGTPECGMAALLPSLEKRSLTASLMTSGYDPELAAKSPYLGAKGAIREALAKFACLGGDPFGARLSLQEYFGRTEKPEDWGRPAAALLGALEAQLELGVPAIGGKDSMSGNYRDPERGIDITVPPSLVAFAAGTTSAPRVRSGALSGKPGNILVLLAQEGGEKEWESFRRNMRTLAELSGRGIVRAAYPVGPGGAAPSLALMAFGNMTGIEVSAAALALPAKDWHQGSVLLELEPEGPAFREGDFFPPGSGAAVLGRTVAEQVFRVIPGGGGSSAPSAAPGGGAEIPLQRLREAWESPLAEVYPQVSGGEGPRLFPGPRIDGIIARSREKAPRRGSVPGGGKAAPLVTIPVFPGTNCEWDMERAFREAGARTRLVVFRNLNRDMIGESTGELAEAIAGSQMLALPGGFSAGDEPDGSGKFIANVFRSPPLADALGDLLERRDGLVLGICNGFQALIKLGLVPYGEIRDAEDGFPALTFNRLGRHVSRMVRTRILSTGSPWLSLEEPGAMHTIPVSHGEGRIVIRPEEAEALLENGQIPACYVDAGGRPAGTGPDNPNGSGFAIEALASPDGRILGKMGHSERQGPWVHVNIPGNKKQRIFEAGVRYFS